MARRPVTQEVEGVRRHSGLQEHPGDLAAAILEEAVQAQAQTTS